MDNKFESAGKEVLVEIVKLAQKRGLKGSKGTWKEFLTIYDTKFGVSLSDPARRTVDVLLDFVNTFTGTDDLQFFEKVMQCHLNRNDAEKFKKKSADSETPEQRLVRATVEHPFYTSSYCFPSYEEGWLITKRSKKSKSMRSTDMIAVDCEMALGEDGSEALVKVCVVDRNLEVKLNELVKPNKAIADYRTDITGVSAEDLDGVTCTLTYIQKSIKNMLRYGTILVGHSLNNDLQVLKIDHARVIDTSFIFKYGDGSSLRRPSLSDLCKSVLGFELRKKGTPHNCLDDACAAMKLVLAKVEGGVDNVILPTVHKNVSEVELEKLLLHNIPTAVSKEEIHNIVPGDFTIEIKGEKKGGGTKYSAIAVFKNPQEANQAFEDVEGNEDKDSSGRPQKLVALKLSTGVSGSLYVRKMGDGVHIATKKRSFADEDTLSLKSKKSKTETESNDCESHVKEIERLKQELSQRDQEISNLNKIIAALARKQGL